MAGQKRFIDKEDDLRDWISRLHSEIESMKQLLDKDDYEITRSDVNLSQNSVSGEFPEKEFLEVIIKPLKDRLGKINDFEIISDIKDLKSLGIKFSKKKKLSVGNIAGSSSKEFINFLKKAMKSDKCRITEFYNDIADRYFQIIVNAHRGKEIELLLQDLTSFQKHKLQVKRYADLYYKAEESSTTGFFQYISTDNKILVSEGILSIFECFPQASPSEYFSIGEYLATVHEDDKEMVIGEISEDNISSSIDYEHRIRIRNKVKHIHVRGSIFYDTIDDSISLIGTAEDITEFKKVESQRNFLRARLDEVEKIAQVASWNYCFIKDEFTGSDSICDILGMTREEFPISFSNLINMLHDDSREEVNRKYHKSVSEKHDLITDFKIIDKMGKEHNIHFLCWNFYREDGKPEHSRGYFIDETDMMNLRAELIEEKDILGEVTEELVALKKNYDLELKEQLNEIRKQDKYRIQDYKWNSISNLLNQVALHWQEPLLLLSSKLQNLVEVYQFGEMSPETMGSMYEELKQIMDQMKRNLSIFREHFDNQTLKKKFSLKQLLEEIVSIMKISLEEQGISLNLTAEADLEISGDKTDLSEPVINVIYNASTIIKKRHIDDPRIDITLRKNTENMIMEIFDNGGGIHEDHIEHIFEAYYSAEDIKEANGMGLFIAKKLVENKLSGKLEGFNHGAGACFRFTFPNSK